jgi:hypothetical protein
MGYRHIELNQIWPLSIAKSATKGQSRLVPKLDKEILADPDAPKGAAAN